MSKASKGKRGPRGEQGRRGAPGIEPEEINKIISDIEKIQDEASHQFKRIAQMQVQIDGTLKALKDLGERAGRQRTKKSRSRSG